ncbi:MAG TPA: NAD(P)-binding domain-containing protein, partial [Saprospiraceae bacterium]|nr:NAD(P)-binding domain-containing protein [Saprospiraceae bacterium]
EKKIGIIGSGVVGVALANGLHKHGYAITLGTNDAEKYEDLKSKTQHQVEVGSFEQAARSSDLLVLAVKGSAAEEIVRALGNDLLRGKTILDTTNPIKEGPPTNGVLSYFTSLDESLMERLQRLAPDALFVKCFSCVGNVFMVDPNFGGAKPSMFICGNDEDAKTRTRHLLDEIGWETEDMGKVEAARAIEPLCILWCIPGMIRGQWMHALKLLKLY